ncbi:MAG TPA: lysoplasmalogenase [Aeromicrobium sp.]|nr:lysoplasmalogenase [Aeromicrobium sp.]
MTAVKSPFIIGFGIVMVVHLALLGLGVSPWDTVTKVLLAPLLAAWAWQLEGPRLLVLGLVFCFFGDLFMDLDGWFVAGMAAFAAAHICFITLFVQRGALSALGESFAGRERWRALLAVLYVIGAVGVVAWAWGGFDPTVRFAVPVYALLLASTASTAMALDTRSGVGAALFVLSDSLIALGEAGRLDAEATWHKLAVMVLYLLGIFLITAGVLNRERRTRRIAADGFDITQRTDCWPRLP